MLNNADAPVAELDPLLRALDRRDDLSSAESGLIETLPRRHRNFRRGEELVAQHSEPRESCLLLEGFAARAVYLRDGSRQFTALHVAGDFVDLHALLLKVMDHSVVALSDCRAAFVPHASIQRIIEASPHLGRLLWLTTTIDGAIQRTWNASLGRRSAPARLGHLICELYRRLEAVGLAENYFFSFPATQAEIADILGITPVHANRIIQDLRRASLITWAGTSVSIVDFQKLAGFCDFDPTFLNFIRMPR